MRRRRAPRPARHSRADGGRLHQAAPTVAGTLIRVTAGHEHGINVVGKAAPPVALPGQGRRAEEAAGRPEALPAWLRQGARLRQVPGRGQGAARHGSSQLHATFVADQDGSLSLRTEHARDPADPPRIDPVEMTYAGTACKQRHPLRLGDAHYPPTCNPAPKARTAMPTAPASPGATSTATGSSARRRTSRSTRRRPSPSRSSAPAATTPAAPSRPPSRAASSPAR